MSRRVVFCSSIIGKTKMEGSPADSADHQQHQEMDVTDFTTAPTVDEPLADALPTSADDHDARSKGVVPTYPGLRAEAPMVVERDSEDYNMSHGQRGVAAIYVHERYATGGPPRRPTAEQDVDSCEDAFKHLGYKVRVFWDLNKKQFMRSLEELAAEDHSNRDSIVVVVMSHGSVECEREFIWTFDSKIKTCAIWSVFTADKSPTLAGKPKLFFIQACRGEKTDPGVKVRRSLAVETDSLPNAKEPDYVIPIHADILIMWASYPGMFAFKTGNNGISGSVFIHFLREVLCRAKKGDDLFTLLLRVTRKVAIEYESYMPHTPLDHQKQSPYIASTLTRRVFFT